METKNELQKLIDELGASIGNDSLQKDLSEKLQKVRALLNQMKPLDKLPLSPEKEEAKEPFNKKLRGSLKGLTSGIKNGLKGLTILNLFVLNHSLNLNKAIDILNAYFEAIFGSDTFSIISTALQLHEAFCSINKWNVSQNQAKTILVEEFEKQFTQKYDFAWIDLSTTSLLRTFFLSRSKPSENLLCFRFFTASKDQFFILINIPNDNVLFAKTATESDLLEHFSGILDFVSQLVSMISDEKYSDEGKTQILNALESLKIDYLNLVRSVFIEYLQHALAHNFQAEVEIKYTEEKLATPHSKARKFSDEKKKLFLNIVSASKIELSDTFFADLTPIATEVSLIWSELNRYQKNEKDKVLNGFMRKQEAKDNPVFVFDFDKDYYLCQQNIPVPPELEGVITINNFLSVRTSLSFKILFKNTKFVSQINETLEEFARSAKLIATHKLTVDGFSCQIIMNKSENRRNKIKRFTILIPFEKAELNGEANGIDKVIEQAKQTFGKSHKDHFDVVKKKIRSYVILKKLIDHSNDQLYTKQEISAMRNSTIAEYLPDEDIPTINHGMTLGSKTLDVTQMASLILNVKNFKSLDSLDLTGGPSYSLKNLKPASSKDKLFIQLGQDEKYVFDSSCLVLFDDDEQKLSQWTFDSPSIQSNLEKSRLVWFMLESTGFLQKYPVDRGQLCSFITDIQKGYEHRRKNPFHNFDHGVTGFDKHFTDLINFAMVLSAYCHDVDHTGSTNNFEIAKQSKLALRYNDRSVLEQHHAAYTFKTMAKPENNIMHKLDPKDSADIRKMMIACILATDMKVHFEQVKSVQAFDQQLRDASPQDDFHLRLNSHKWSDDDLRLITGFIVRCADLCWPSMEFEIAYYWSERINQEFTDQVKEEQSLRLPVTNYMLGLDTPVGMAKNEISFIKFVIKPLWDCMASFSHGNTKFISDSVNKNLQKWEELLKNAEADSTSPTIMNKSS